MSKTAQFSHFTFSSPPFLTTAQMQFVTNDQIGINSRVRYLAWSGELDFEGRILNRHGIPIYAS